MPIRLSGEICGRPEALLAREWLDTNGLGGYASGTVLTSHSRKYHGLLVANLPPPANGRHVLLSKYEESVVTPAGEQVLTAHHFPGGIFPENRLLPAAFEQDDFPSWTYRLATGATLTRSLMLLRGRNTLLTRFALGGDGGRIRLRVKPFLAFRRNHDLMRENDGIRRNLHPLPHGVRVEPYGGMPSLFFQWTPGRLHALEDRGGWYRNFEYLEEMHRGFEFREDLFLPFQLEFSLAPGEDLILAAGTDAAERGLEGLWAGEADERAAGRRRNLAWLRRETKAAKADLEVPATLLRAAGQLAIRTPSGRPALLAGHHWFEDWGRDTMIALPGCLFFSPRREEGFEILAAFSEREQGGLLPNYINPDGTASYNSVDAALWFFWAVQQYLLAGGKPAAVRNRCWPVMRRILAAYAGGITTPPVHMDGRGLLHAGTPATQLTWMDANCDGRPVTPRWGYAVEINALWYNAVAFASELAVRFKDKTFAPPVRLPALAREFRKLFWLPASGGLADVVNAEGTDASVRPNQIFAVSLPYSPVTNPMAKRILDTVTRHLLTPCGLRTLAPADPRYRGQYRGGPQERDSAYHQGTVWPWLFGAYADAFLRVNGNNPLAHAVIRTRLGHWAGHLSEAGIGCVSEIFDAEPPFRPNGCISQAWSAGELLRAFHLAARPPGVTLIGSAGGSLRNRQGSISGGSPQNA